MKKLTLLSLLVVTCFFVSGCNDVGNQPSGMSNQDAKSAIDKMTPEEKIKFFASSPLPAAEKQAKYDEIEKETGVKASDVLSGQPVVPGPGTPIAP